MKAQLKMIMLACAVAGGSLMLSSCGAQIQQRKGNSGKTGWAYNDPKWGGFEVAEYVVTAYPYTSIVASCQSCHSTDAWGMDLSPCGPIIVE